MFEHGKMTVAAAEQHDVDRLIRHGEDAHSIGEQAAATRVAKLWGAFRPSRKHPTCREKIPTPCAFW